MRRLGDKKNLNTLEFWNDRFISMDTWRNDTYSDFLIFAANNGLFINKKFSLLDVGCSLGDGIALMQKKFPESRFTGLDFSSIAIRKASGREIPNANWTCVDLYECVENNLDIGEFDYITMIQTLEHMEEPEKIVEYLWSKCKKSLFISVPSPTHPLAFDVEHIQLFSRNSFDNNEILNQFIRYRSIIGVRLNFVFSRELSMVL